MTQSVFLTVYFTKKFNEEEDGEKFLEDVDQAKKIFRQVWPKLGNGFDSNHNIKGLKEKYIIWGYEDSAENLSEKERGELSIFDLNLPENNDNYSFNHHNFRGDLNMIGNIDFRDIYTVFGEILSTCFGYVVNVSYSFKEELDFSWFFDEDGYSYQIKRDRTDYFNSVKQVQESKETIKKEKQRLKEAEKFLKDYNNGGENGND